jgi:glycosyl transferase family 2
MSLPPRVSVIVPVRNRRDLLGGLLEALSRQTHRDFEIVVVDDGSSDGSAKEANVWAERGLPVRLIRTEGIGAVGARCAGVASARGEILAFTDSDCEPAPGWLDAGIVAIDRGADVVQGMTRPTREVGALDHSVAAADDTLYNTCNVFYRRDAYETAGGFDSHIGTRFGFRPGPFGRGLGFGEDTVLGWRVRRVGNAAYAPDAAVGHHVLTPSLQELVARAWMAGAFPALVREVPELRRTLLRRGMFLGRSRMPMYASAVALVLRRRGLAAAAAAWWVASRAREVARAPGTKRTRAASLPLELLRDVVTGGALLTGSFRARTPVL